MPSRAPFPARTSRPCRTGTEGWSCRRTAQKKTILTEGQAPETVIVTGSRIPQTGCRAASASPVVLVGRQEFELLVTTDVTTLVNSLPQESSLRRTPNLSNGATGTDNVNLRDLGARRTLVLIDGSRLMPGDPADPAADINAVPAALVIQYRDMSRRRVSGVRIRRAGGRGQFHHAPRLRGYRGGRHIFHHRERTNNPSRWRNLISGPASTSVLRSFAEPANNVWNGQTGRRDADHGRQFGTTARGISARFSATAVRPAAGRRNPRRLFRVQPFMRAQRARPGSPKL